MSWGKDALDTLAGQLPREEIQLAMFAVTADYRLAQAVDYMMLTRNLDQKAGIALF